MSERYVIPVVKQLKTELLLRFHDMELYTNVERPEHGREYMYLYLNQRLIVIEWQPMVGFAVVSRLGGEHCTGCFEHSEIIRSVREAAFEDITEIPLASLVGNGSAA